MATVSAETLEIRMSIPADFAAHIAASHPDSLLRAELTAMLGQLAIDALLTAQRP